MPTSIAEPDYPDHWKRRTVDANKRISYQGNLYRIGKPSPGAASQVVPDRSLDSGAVTLSTPLTLSPCRPVPSRCAHLGCSRVAVTWDHPDQIPESSRFNARSYWPPPRDFRISLGVVGGCVFDPGRAVEIPQLPAVQTASHLDTNPPNGLPPDLVVGLTKQGYCLLARRVTPATGS